MGSMHTYLDPRRLAALADDPDFKPAQGDHAQRIIVAETTLGSLLAEKRARQAESAVLETATAALDVSRRAAYEAFHDQTGPWRSATAKPAGTVEEMQDQLREANASLAAADIALCAWYGKPDMSRARVLMNDAVAFLAEG